MGVELQVEVEAKEVRKMLSRIATRSGKPPLRRIAVVGTKSINRNFRLGGRPKKWAKLKAGQGRAKGTDSRGRPQRKKGSHPRAAGKPLLNTTSLAKSVHAEYLGRTNVKIATKHPVAAHHQYGTGTHGKRGAPYWIGPKNKKVLSFIASSGARVASRGHFHPGIVARPFIGWQESDATEIQKILADHIANLDGAG